MAMSVQFVWENKYSVGNPEIDEQHKGMFELGNRLPELSNARDIKPIIMRLYKHTREHFSHEEKMMKSIGFPLLAEHTLLHENLITQLNKISSQPLDADEAVYGFKKFIHDWLIDHIMKEDNSYFQFSKEQSEPSSNKPDTGVGK
jgi:hemerythrin